MKDNIFLEPLETHSNKFEFNEQVASVFDDMLLRSVPFYKDVISLTSSLIAKYTNKNDKVVDFGCSTASTLIEIAKYRNDLNLIGIDNSKAMIQRASSKLGAFGVKATLLCKNFFDVDIHNMQCVIANYTIQFIQPDKREELLLKIYNGLNKNGFLIFSEKIIYQDNKLNSFLIDEYYNLKRKNGYSEFEISHKKEALENILVPLTEQENKKMVLNAGFNSIETIFKWANFTTFIAFK